MQATTPQTAYQPPWWFVRSARNAHLFYRISADARGVLRCECKAAQFNRRPCRHCTAVVEGRAIAATPKRVSVTPEPFTFQAPDDRSW